MRETAGSFISYQSRTNQKRVKAVLESRKEGSSIQERVGINSVCRRQHMPVLEHKGSISQPVMETNNVIVSF